MQIERKRGVSEMARQSVALLTQTSEEAFPELPTAWLAKPANDLVVLSPEPFGGALRAAPSTANRSRGKLRIGGLITTTAVGLAIAAAAVVLTIGWFSVMDPRSGTNLSMTVGTGSSASPTTQLASRQAMAVTPDLSDGINALRSQMQAAQAANPTPATRVDVATAEKLEVNGSPNVAAGTAIVLAPPSAAPLTGPVAPQLNLTINEIRAMLDRAKRLIAVGDIAAARRLAEYVAASGDGGALFTLAETFDPKQLARWRVRGVRADIERARNLYHQAFQRGVAEAQTRLVALP